MCVCVMNGVCMVCVHIKDQFWRVWFMTKKDTYLDLSFFSFNLFFENYTNTYDVFWSQGLHKIKIAKIPGWMEGLRQPHLCWKNYWQLMAAGKGRVSFLLSCTPWQAVHIPGDGPTAIHTLETISKLCRFLKDPSDSYETHLSLGPRAQ